MQTITDLYASLSPLIQQQIASAIGANSTDSAGSGITGSLANYLNKYGDTIVGNIFVNPNITIDGIDISELALKAYPITLDVITTNAQSNIGHTHQITTSSSPGANPVILASNAQGLARLEGFGGHELAPLSRRVRPLSHHCHPSRVVGFPASSVDLYAAMANKASKLWLIKTS